MVSLDKWFQALIEAIGLPDFCESPQSVSPLTTLWIEVFEAAEELEVELVEAELEPVEELEEPADCETIKFCPMKIVSEFKWFQLLSWAIVVLYLTESPQSVSPDLTLIVVCEAGLAGVTEVVGVVVAAEFPEEVELFVLDEEVEVVNTSFCPI